jgi:N-acetylmuramoyl-L-alanine amidase
MKWYINPGHGGSETGAIGYGLVEKNINLVVALELARILKEHGQEVRLSRTSDITMSLAEVCNDANNWKADRFISVHHNAFNGVKAGTEIYYSIHGGKGADLADDIAKVFEQYGRPTARIQRRGIKNPSRDYYYVIANTNMPAIITEAGYIDSKDYINFDTTEELYEQAKQIAIGCLDHVGIAFNSAPNTTVVTEEHWAQKHYDALISKGIIIHDKRFDDKITRGELFALLNQILK